MTEKTEMPFFLQSDPHPDEHGVLVRNRIKQYANKGMIRPFNDGKLKSAGYRLSIGDEYLLGGVQFRLRCQDCIVIPPYEVAVIKTAEYIQMPWFLIGRWNIQVSRAYDGLLWVGAAQVDPGYEGNLFCPIYNLSNKEVRLYRGDNIALIDFVKTTPIKGGEIRAIKHDFGDFGKQLESGLLSHRRQVDDLQNRVDEAEKRIWLFAALVISMIGMVVALISKNGVSSNSSGDWLLPLAFGLSFASVFLSVLWVVGLFFRPLGKTFSKMLSQNRLFSRQAFPSLAIGVFLAIAFVFSIYWAIDRGIDLVQKKPELEKKYHDLKGRVERLEMAPVTSSEPEVD